MSKRCAHDYDCDCDTITAEIQLDDIDSLSYELSQTPVLSPDFPAVQTALFSLTGIRHASTRGDGTPAACTRGSYGKCPAHWPNRCF